MVNDSSGKSGREAWFNAQGGSSVFVEVIGKGNFDTEESSKKVWLQKANQILSICLISAPGYV